MTTKTSMPIPGIFLRQFIPYRTHHVPCLIKPHFPVHDFPKDASFIVCAYRYEVGTGLRIIKTSQTDGLTVVFIRVVHGFGLQEMKHLAYQVILPYTYCCAYCMMIQGRPSIQHA